MKHNWILHGLLVLSLLAGGCTWSGRKGAEPADKKEMSPEEIEHFNKSRLPGNTLDWSDPKGWSESRSEARRDFEQMRNKAPDRELHGRVVEENAALQAGIDRIRAMEQQGKPVEPMPVLPQYDRLTDIMVSLEMDKVDVRQALRALAKQTSLNLLLDPVVLEEAPIITVSFQKVSAATVLREVLRLADLHGVIEDNVLRVLPTQEIIIPLNFLETNHASSFESGGDVLGASGAKGALKGGFSMSGSAKSTNPYEPIEAAVTALVSGKKGSFQINRQTGTLYMSAKPSAIKSVNELLQRYKEILARQILIEARIIEVQLSDQFKTGINWANMRRNLAITSGMWQIVSPGGIMTNANNNAQINDGSTVILPGAAGDALLGSTSRLATTQGAKVPRSGLGFVQGGDNSLIFLDLLKQFGDVRTLSNPTIRARHGQPAMISVGTSMNYVNETRVTQAAVQGQQPTTEVRTSTLFDGVMMGVVPFIGTEGKITMTIHPIQSTIDQSSLTAQTYGTSQVTLPRLNLKEMSTVLELQDRDTVFLGGLIDKSTAKYRTGVPVLSEIPLLGRLFTNDQATETARELVLMMRVTIL
ncbi:MAG: pilus (MSHA type) biogenesis protein MshL [Magnetococcales bacterium]|nr:pilus (MSHA type) biogenesis protein MshL [Magnetococcales bacterium]